MNAWYGLILDDREHRQLYVPPDFGHAFAVLSDVADFNYLCTDYYHPTSEGAVAWDDPAIAIAWPTIEGPWLLSDKDRSARRLATIDPSGLPRYPG